MDLIVFYINKISAVSTIAIQLLIILLIISLFSSRRRENKFFGFFKRNILTIGFLASMGASLVSLFYSEIAGFPPCKLCWLMRIFMFPQAILFGLAILKRDRGIIDYGLALSIPGAGLALYNYLGQMNSSIQLPCSAEEVSCAVRYVFEFGYITIPMMALTIFALIIVLALLGKKSPVQGL